MELIRDSLRPEMKISHNEEEMIWSLSAFSVINFKVDFDMFQYPNQYWENLPQAEQEAIFGIYKQIRLNLDRGLRENELVQSIQMLYEIHRIEKIKQWILFRSDIQFPSDLLHEYVQSNDKTGSRDQTYLKSDYIELVALTFSLRLMIPIWGEYISRVKHEMGTQFKEYCAFQLLNHTTLDDSEAMHKLKTYICCSIPDEPSKSSIIDGVSSEDFPIWITSQVVIRRLCTSDIRGVGPNSSLIPFIYNHVKERHRRSDTNFAGLIKDKRVGDDSSDNSQRISKLEGFKIKQANTPGDVVALEYALSDMHKVAEALCSGIDHQLVENALQTSDQLRYREIRESQIILLQWVFKPYISPRAMHLVNKDIIVKALGVAQAILWHRGHHVLSGLVTATDNISDDTSFIGGVESRARITKDLMEKLNTLFPYIKKSGNKNRVTKVVNHAVASIDALCDALSNFDWVLTMDQVLVQYLTGSTGVRQFSIPHDIKIKLAKFVIEQAELGAPQPQPGV